MFKKIAVVVCVLGAAVLNLACGKPNAVGAILVELSPAQAKQQEMEDAAYYDSFVVVFNKEGASTDDQYAICNGTSRVVGLDAGETRRVELSTQEALNASLCRWNEESGAWSTVQDISGVSPGDYLVWDNCLHWTRYTPQ